MIYQKLSKIQGELKVPKAQKNTYANYNYRSCEDILEALKPILAESGCVIFIRDSLVQVGDRYYIQAEVTLVEIETAEKLSVTAWAREEETKKGFDGSQITGASSSYARKYALNGLFGIDDAKDSDATNEGAQGDGKKAASSTTQQNEWVFWKTREEAIRWAIANGLPEETVEKDYETIRNLGRTKAKTMETWFNFVKEKGVVNGK